MSAHIFIDADNVKPEIGFKAIEKFSNEYLVEQVDIIGNEATLSSRYLEASDRYSIKNCFFGTNSADTWLCTEIAKTIFEKPEIDTIIIVSSDRDFLAAIKLVTDQNRKVIFVSDGNGHKNLKALFYDLRINPDLVELVDFKTDFATPQPEKKKVNVEPVEIPFPTDHTEKIKAACRKKLPNHLKAFYYKNESEFTALTLKIYGREVEVPFFDGINFSTFTNILVALKIIPNGKAIFQVLDDNMLELIDNKVYIRDKISPEIFEAIETEKKIEPEKSYFEDVINYFTAHAAESKDIFVKCGEKIYEVPFINGISLNMFARLLKGYAIAEDLNLVKKIVADSFLDLRDNRIYFHSEDEISDDLQAYMEIMPPESLNYFKRRERDLKFVTIANNGEVHRVPFVEGIKLSTFVYMLRHLKIFSKNSNSLRILNVNGFIVKDDSVFKKQ